MLYQGMLLQLPGRRGVGKLDSVTDGIGLLKVFHSSVRSSVIEQPIDELERAYLSPQTRVYIEHDGGFKVGRVTNYLRQDNGLIDYEVRFPNGRQGDFSELKLHVRPWNAPDDPAEVLAAGCAESQYLHDRRQSAVAPLLQLRSAAQGLTALLSAGVEFVPHQVAAVRRVLTDPVQRYLLADEVGLGKTIEAGLIIRQHLIDDPDTAVLIATPAHLSGQWRGELTNKLRLSQFGEAFECVAHADLAHVRRSPDVLVVDEAHHLVGVDSGPLTPAAKRLVELAAEVPTLLLLSATPPLGDERRFLALLNLLDPETHPLDDVEAFTSKLERRRDIGRLLLSLDPDNPGLVLRKRSEEMLSMFADDPIVAELAPQLIEATRHDGVSIAGLCGALKAHIAETYRIHQRLIRSRRADAKGWEFMPRGPLSEGEQDLNHVRLESDPSDMTVALMASIEDWRSAALAEVTGDDRLITVFASHYVRLLEALSSGHGALVACLADLPAASPVLAEIAEALRSMAEQLDDEQEIATIVESTSRLLRTLKGETARPKAVAFAPTEARATDYYEELHKKQPELSLELLTISGVEHNPVDRFERAEGSAILVADQSGEEGLNLSCADAIVHIDLPFSAARLEQRIGRLDRFGRRQSMIRHRILLPSDEDGSPYAAWFDFLSQGLMIFNRSISDVQFLLDGIEEEAFLILFRDGPEALRANAESIRARIAEERKSQDEQYALDRIALADEPVEAYLDALEDAESDEGVLEKQVDRWLVQALQFKKRPFAWPAEDPFKLGTTPTTLVPKEPWLSEFGVDDTIPLTWRRRIAARNGTTTLLRPGTPFVDMVDRFTRWDDRGTAFITWRVAPDWRDETWVGFRLCLVIEPDIPIYDMLAPTIEERAALRHAQRYLPARYELIHVDTSGSPVTDPVLLSALSLPYRGSDQGGSDVNLSQRLHYLEQVIDLDSFRTCCRTVRDQAVDALRSQASVNASIRSASDLADADLERRRIRLQRREASGDSIARADLQMLEALLPAIRTPSVRVDAMGCFIVASQGPGGAVR